MSRNLLLYKIAPAFLGIFITKCLGSNLMLSEKQQINSDISNYIPRTPETKAELSPSILNAPLRIDSFKGIKKPQKQYISYITPQGGYNHKYTKALEKRNTNGKLKNLLLYRLKQKTQKEHQKKIHQLMETYRGDFIKLLKYFPCIQSKYGNLGLYMFCRNITKEGANNNNRSNYDFSVSESEIALIK